VGKNVNLITSSDMLKLNYSYLLETNNLYLVLLFVIISAPWIENEAHNASTHIAVYHCCVL